jgi:transposase
MACWGGRAPVLFMGCDGYTAKHFRVHHGENEFARSNSHINGIEPFWAYAKLRLAKLKGIPAKTFPLLHLKETEFRFNHRQDNRSLRRSRHLYKTLLGMLRENPL